MDERRSKLTHHTFSVTEVDKKQLEGLRKKQKEIGLSSKSGNYVNHVYQVYLDIEFRDDVSTLREKLETLYYKDISFQFEVPAEHLLYEDAILIKQLADKYCISMDDLAFFADGHYAKGSSDFGRRKEEFGGLHNNWENHERLPLCYVIGPKTSLQDIVDDWAFIKDYRHAMYFGKGDSAIVRNKSSEQPELVYAIFKARSRGLTFSVIFNEYAQGILSGNTIKHASFSNAESLERYYRKYKPDIQKNDLSYDELNRVKQRLEQLEAMKRSPETTHLFDYPDT